MFHYRWCYELDASPEFLWPFVSDTNRFNRDTGIPHVEAMNDKAAERSANGRRRLRLSRLGVAVQWEEMPFEWCRPHRFGVLRRYATGPVGEMRVLVDMEPIGAARTKLTYEVWVTPRNALGYLAIPYQIGFVSARRFARVFARYGALAKAYAEGRAMPLPRSSRVDLAPGGARRLDSFLATLRTRVDARLADRLGDVIRTGDDFLVARMRPYELAAQWNVSRRTALEVFLHAARVGLLDLQWELLCPLCRGAQESHGTMREVTASSHCATCGIDFTVSFENSVELTFRPNPAVRAVHVLTYCTGGPQVTPHILVQQILAPHEARVVRATLEPGRYRVRAPGVGASLRFTVDTAAASTQLAVDAKDDVWDSEERVVRPDAELHLQNGAQERLFIVERTAWSDDATTAAEVTAMQQFRDLFSSEALRPGEHISVGSLAVLFTDLRDSTRMYREIGDAPAFGRVMSHFDLLRDAIAHEEGTIVKTIGDSVMAVFRRPAGAVRAMLHAQQQLAMPPIGDPLFLKAGLHYGACIAVTLNERLDYFGSTVNLAARLDSLSTGGEVIVSDAIACDPEVMELMQQEEMRTEKFEAQLKGFEDEPVGLWKIARSVSDRRPSQQVPVRA